MKISHRIISLKLIETILKFGTTKTIIEENPVHSSAYILHSKIDYDNRILHVFFHDPVNGIECPEGSDITKVPSVYTVFRVVENDDLIKSMFSWFEKNFIFFNNTIHIDEDDYEKAKKLFMETK